mmetsp:Transcript_67085/g.145894  ORF Transcript_67085/g.145894 Transcript_67085/m.145894 type:complete len:158 (+) Transcript_67085:530-1003(+)
MCLPIARSNCPSWWRHFPPGSESERLATRPLASERHHVQRLLLHWAISQHKEPKENTPTQPNKIRKITQKHTHMITKRAPALQVSQHTPPPKKLSRAIDCHEPGPRVDAPASPARGWAHGDDARLGSARLGAFVAVVAAFACLTALTSLACLSLLPL